MSYAELASPERRRTRRLATRPLLTERRASVMLILVFLLAMWTPSEYAGAPEWLANFRYMVFASLVAALGVYGVIRPAARWSWTIEATLMLAFLVYAVVSSFWAEPSVFAYSKAVLLALSLLFCLGIARQFDLPLVLKNFFVAAGIFVILGLIAIAVRPDIGIETGWGLEGKWRGLAGQKNEFGAIASLGLLGMLIPGLWRTAAHQKRHRYLPTMRALTTALCAVALVMSGSRGAQLSFGVGVVMLMLLSAPRAIRNGLFVVAGTAGLVAAIVLLSGVEIDTSNRIIIWSFGFSELSGRELFGMGLGGFWTEERTLQFLRDQGWVLDNFHSGYVSAYIELGAFGVLLIALLGAAVIATAAQSLSTQRPADLIAAACVCVMFASANLVENWLIRSTNFYLLVFVLIVLAMGQRRAQS